MDGLTVGRMVHFISYYGGCRAAIVTKVWNKENGVVNLNVQNDMDLDLKGGLNKEVYSVTSVTYSDDNVGGSWHWIEKA